MKRVRWQLCVGLFLLVLLTLCTPRRGRSGTGAGPAW